MGKVLAIFRLFFFALVAISATCLLLIGRLFGESPRYSYAVFRGAIWLLRKVLNIRVHYHGTVPRDQGVIMSNHRSYIDVVLVPSAVPYVVVAKAQVRSWPIVGQVCRALRIIFVDRDSMESRRATREQIRQRLAAGMSVLIYPEGTTHIGPDVLPFKPGMFNTCAEGGFRVIPIAVEYRDRDMAWIGNDTFVPHFMRAFAHWRIDVAVGLGPALQGSDAAALRSETQQWVEQETLRLRKLWDGA